MAGGSHSQGVEEKTASRGQSEGKRGRREPMTGSCFQFKRPIGLRNGDDSSTGDWFIKRRIKMYFKMRNTTFLGVCL